MNFDDLVDESAASKPYTQAPAQVLGTQGLDPSQPPQQFLGQVLDKMVGTQQRPEGIDPVDSPIDYLAGAAGAKLGSKLAQAATSAAAPSAVTSETVHVAHNPLELHGEGREILLERNGDEPIAEFYDGRHTGHGSTPISKEEAEAPTIPTLTPTPFADGGSVPQQPASLAGDLDPWFAEGGVAGAAPNFDSLQEDANPQVGLVNQGASQTPNFDSLQDDTEKYGTGEQQFKAGLEGFGQGLVGPLAPAIERGFGVNPADIRGRAEANPGTHLAGEAAGLIAPALVTGGGSTAARFTVAGGLEALTKGIGLKAGETLASKIGVGAAKAAVDNMLIAGSDEASKLVLQDPNQSANTALLHVGLAGAIGAGAGAAFGGASALWKAAQETKAGSFVSGFTNRMKEHADGFLKTPEVPTAETSGVAPVEGASESASNAASMAPKVNPDAPISDTDPFTKEPVEPATETPESVAVEAKPIPAAQKLGAKAADAFVAKALDKLSGESVGASTGAAMGSVFGHPAIGAIVGSRALGPFFNSVLPGIGRSLMNALPSGEGFKVASDFAASVFKGEKLLSETAKNVFRTGSSALSSDLYPSNDELNKLDSKLKTLQTNVTPLLQSNKPLQHYLPQHDQALTQTTSSAAGYLNSIRAGTGKQSPLDSEPVLSNTQKSEYKNSLTIAQQPLVVLDKIKSGTVTANDIKAIQTMYPALYERFHQKLNDEMIEAVNRGDNIPYRTRIGLSMFMAHPLDSSMLPSSIQAAQPKSQQQQPQQNQAPRKGSKSSPALQKLPSIYASPSQARAQENQKPD